MAWYERHTPYRAGNSWKIEFPDNRAFSPRWREMYSLWLWDRQSWKYIFERLMTKDEADCFGRVR